MYASMRWCVGQLSMCILVHLKHADQPQHGNAFCEFTATLVACSWLMELTFQKMQTCLQMSKVKSDVQAVYNTRRVSLVHAEAVSINLMVACS